MPNFRLVPGLSSRVMVNQLGVVRNADWSHKSIRINKDGYKELSLELGGVKKKYTVHECVLRAFRGPRPPGMVCRHLNNNKLDNRLENLVWGTALQNIQDRVEASPAGLKAKDLPEVWAMLFDGVRQEDIAEYFDVSGPTISQIKRGAKWVWIAPECWDQIFQCAPSA